MAPATHDTGIIKQGARHVMQLDAVNTYAGPTTISAGTLTINSSALLGGAAGAYGGLITNNGTLNYNNSWRADVLGRDQRNRGNERQRRNPDLVGRQYL